MKMYLCVFVLIGINAVIRGTLLPSSNTEISIAAFNIQSFGLSKINMPQVVEVLRKILVRYDIVMIQEIRDATFTAIFELLDEVNDESPHDQYDMEMSERLGSSHYKEQYAFFYRPSKVNVVDIYQYPVYSEFARPPFSVLFVSLVRGKVTNFAVSVVHVKPAQAVGEIDRLVNVYEAIGRRWGLQDVVIAGDYNAGCSYVRPGDWSNIRLRTETRFDWLIDDDANTTTNRNTNCPYDRLVIAGTRMKQAYKPGSAIVYRFDSEMNLDYDLAMAVSDHVPVEMILE